MTLQNLKEYGRPFQLKVLGALLTDGKFILSVQDILKVEYFDNSADQWIVQQILKYFADYRTNITMEVLKIELQKVENEVLKVAVKEELKHSYQASQEDLQYVEEEFTNFCRNQEMKRAILESADLLKTGNFEAIRSCVENALKAGLKKGMGQEYKKSVEARYRENYRPVIPTPWEPINLKFDGGLGPGDLFLIFGGPGTGKSWLSIACAAYAVQCGYNVIYYTLELSEDYVGRRFDSYITGYSVQDCEIHKEEVKKLMDDLPGNLIIKEYAPKEASISTLEAHMQQCVDEGLKPDLVVVDYVDYLRPAGRSKFSERKDEVDDVYIAFKGMLKRWGIPGISPSQVNRLGAKDDVIEGDKAAGSYDKLMVADGAMSLSRKKEDKVAGTGRIHIMKSRYGSDGEVYPIRINTNNGHVEFGSQEVSEAEQSSSNNPFKVQLDKKLLDQFFSNGNK